MIRQNGPGRRRGPIFLVWVPEEAEADRSWQRPGSVLKPTVARCWEDKRAVLFHILFFFLVSSSKLPLEADSPVGHCRLCRQSLGVRGLGYVTADSHCVTLWWRQRTNLAHRDSWILVLKSVYSNAFLLLSPGRKQFFIFPLLSEKGKC